MASAQLTRTNGTPSSTDIGTVSFWVKRNNLTLNNMYIISNYTDGSNYGYIRWKSDDQLQAYGTQSNDEKRTNRKFRDTNAFTHIVLRVDTTQGTAGNRVRLYINGVQEDSFSTSTNVGQNTDYDLFKSGGSMRIGYIQSGTASYLDGYLAHFHYADGQSYAPTVFGETDATTGLWKPISSPTVTYGNNGFFLTFDNSANMGLDSSGNSNNFSTSGTIIQAKDTPDNVFCTLNPLNNQNTLSLAGNKAVTGGNTGTAGTLGMSKGKYYYEVKVNTAGGSYPFVGFVTQDRYPVSSVGGGTAEWVGNGGLSDGDIVGLALDLDNNIFRGYINGSILAVDSSYVAGSDGAVTAGLNWIPAVSGVNSTFSCNFGNGYFGTTAVSSAQSPSDGIGIFEYAVPTGHKAICTKSLNAQEYS